jgi:RNA polymerase sigma factor (sigma-70 family)
VSSKAEQLDADRALVKEVLEGREGAFERLVERHQRLVWHMIHRLLRNPDDAQDAFQEAFLRVHRELRRFRFESLLSTWIARIAWHAALRFLERKQSPVVAVEAEEGALQEEVAADFDLEASCADAQLLSRVHAAIDELPPLKRAVLTLYYLEDFDVQDISNVLGRPVGTIKSELLRARARIRHRLGVLPGEST